MTDRADLLERFGLVARRDLALMLGVSEKALQNRPKSQLPARVVRVGKQTFYPVDAVRDFLERHTITTGD